MSSATQRVLDDLEKIMAEFEGLVKSTVTAAGDRAGEAAEHLQERLVRARTCVSELGESLGRDVKRGARVTDRYVRDNTWISIGTAAAAAFLIGVLFGRRD